jgi:hypothetical protein
VVKEDVRGVTGVLTALVGIVVGGLGGYVLGVLRTLNERRNERRDAALAEIFKEMSLFYRSLITWTDDPNPDPNKPNPESGIPVRDHANSQYKVFTRAFYGNAIWLGKDTYDLIEDFVKVSRIFLNEINLMRADGSLPAGTNAKDLRAQELSPKFYKVQNKLRAEVEASRYIIPYRIVTRKNREQPRS